MLTLAAMFYESPAVVALGPVWSAVLAGFADIGFDGRVYLSRLGEQYLAERAGG